MVELRIECVTHAAKTVGSSIVAGSGAWPVSLVGLNYRQQKMNEGTSPETVAYRRPAFVHIDGISSDPRRSAGLQSINLRIRRGEILALLGPSGCGKSTLLRIIAGLDQQIAGDIQIEGQSISDLPPHERPVNTMFQSYALFPNLTVAQNVAFGLKQEQLPKSVIEERVDNSLEIVGCTAIAQRKPGWISSELQQRVALARCLAKKPKLLLLDDPMARLDRKLRAEMQLEMAEIVRRVRATCIVATHDQEEAMTMADRIALMRRGRIIQTGTPAEVYEFPNSAFSAEFLGTANLFSGTVSGSEEDMVIVDVPDLGCSLKVLAPEVPSKGVTVTVLVRPEKFELSTESLDDHSNSCQGVIADVAYTGANTTYHVRLNSGRKVVVRVDSRGQQRDLNLEPGAHVFVSWAASDGVLLNS